jgi:hypothetical protein
MKGAEESGNAQGSVDNSIHPLNVADNEDAAT